MQEVDIQNLLKKHLDGSISPAEKELLENWYLQWEIEPQMLTEERMAEITSAIYSRLPKPNRNLHFWRRIAIAAAVATIIFGAGLFYYTNNKSNQSQNSAFVNDIAPGKRGATLTLANGKKIQLSDVVNGEIAKEAGVSITKTADGKLVYQIKEAGDQSGAINTLSTARGEMYDVTLPDGSLVTLNAASSLKYPSNFAAQAYRKVELTGEGYFEIAKVTRISPSGRDGRRPERVPFIVETEGQQVEVLGTHFNISAYTDEATVNTTLLEGSVRVAPLSAMGRTELASSTRQKDDKNSELNAEGREVNRKSTTLSGLHPSLPKGERNIILKPDQQSILSNGNIRVQSIDAQDAVAWKDGLFIFDDEPLENVMRKISRWYNVEIEYLPGVDKQRLFWGSVSRFDKVSTVLEMLESTKNIHFKIEGRRLLVMK